MDLSHSSSPLSFPASDTNPNPVIYGEWFYTRLEGTTLVMKWMLSTTLLVCSKKKNKPWIIFHLSEVEWQRRGDHGIEFRAHPIMASSHVPIESAPSFCIYHEKKEVIKLWYEVLTRFQETQQTLQPLPMTTLDWHLDLVAQKLEKSFSSPAIQVEKEPPPPRMPTPLEHPVAGLDLNQLHLTLLWKLEHLEALQSTFRQTLSSSCPTLANVPAPPPTASLVLQRLEHQLTETQDVLPRSLATQVELMLALDLVQRCQYAYHQLHQQWSAHVEGTRKEAVATVMAEGESSPTNDASDLQQREKWKVFQNEAEQYFEVKKLPEVLQTETTSQAFSEKARLDGSVSIKVTKTEVKVLELDHQLEANKGEGMEHGGVEAKKASDMKRGTHVMPADPHVSTFPPSPVVCLDPPPVSAPSWATSQVTGSMIISTSLDDVVLEDPLDQTQVTPMGPHTIHVHVDLVDGPPLHEAYEIKPRVAEVLENHSATWPPPAAPRSSVADLVDHDEETEPLNATMVGALPSHDAVTMKLKALDATFHVSESPVEAPWNTVSSM